MPRRLVLIAPLLVFALFAGLLLYGPRRGGAPSDPMLGRPVPEFEFPGYDALHPGLAAADLRRGTPTVVNLFASWCLPCRVEAPQLKALTDGGAVVHGVAVRDTPAGLAAFFRNYGNPFRRIGMDGRGSALRGFGAPGLPQTYVVDGRGTIVHVHQGDIRAEDLDVIRAALARAAR